MAVTDSATLAPTSDEPAKPRPPRRRGRTPRWVLSLAGFVVDFGVVSGFIDELERLG